MKSYSYVQEVFNLSSHAALDCLRHNAYCLELDGPSYRAPKFLPKGGQNTVSQKEAESTTV